MLSCGEGVSLTLSLGRGVRVCVLSQVVAFRRLLSIRRLLRKVGAAGASLVNEVGFGDQVLNVVLLLVDVSAVFVRLP